MTQRDLFLALYDAGFDMLEPRGLAKCFDVAAYAKRLRVFGADAVQHEQLRLAEANVGRLGGVRHHHVPAISVRLPRQTTIYTAAYLLVELDHRVGRGGRTHSAKQVKVSLAQPQSVASLLKHAVAALERAAAIAQAQQAKTQKARGAALKRIEAFETELAQNFPDIFGQRAVALRRPSTSTPAGVSLTLEIRGTTSRKVSDVLMALQRMGAEFSHNHVTLS